MYMKLAGELDQMEFKIWMISFSLQSGALPGVSSVPNLEINSFKILIL